MPAYRTIDWAAAGAETDGVLEVWTGETRRDVPLRYTRRRGVPVSFVVADEFFDRDYLYGGPGGDYSDNAERFAFFARAILALADRLEPPPDIIHCHDWQTAPVPVFARADGRPAASVPRTVLTVHNLGYQGLFPAAVWPLLGLDWSYFTPRNLEFYGQVNFLKGGLVHADWLTTVSRRYAEEILDPDGPRPRRRAAGAPRCAYRHLERRRLHRVGPSTRSASGRALSRRRPCREGALQSGASEEHGLRVAPHVPLFGMVSRLADQKGSTSSWRRCRSSCVSIYSW